MSRTPTNGWWKPWREILSLLRAPRDKSAYLEVTEILQRRMGQETYTRVWKEGQSSAMESVIDQAVSLLQRFNQPEVGEGQVIEREGTSIRLSKREREVIGLVAEGLSNQEIAERLFITERTVRYHITSIFNKLGANNRTQAVAIASRLHLL